MRTVTKIIPILFLVLTAACPSWSDGENVPIAPAAPVVVDSAKVVSAELSPAAVPAAVAPVVSETKEAAPVEVKKPSADPVKSSLTPFHVTLDGFIRLVMERNEAVLSQNLDFQISREKINNERAVYEPEFVNSWQRSDDHAKYSNEDKTSILFASEKDERTADVSAMIEGKIPTGAKLKAGYTLREYSDRAASDPDEQYKSYLGVEITQPLLKGAGDTSASGIAVAKADSKLTFQAMRQKRMEISMNALAGCWDLYAAMEKLSIRKASSQIAQTILDDNHVRFKLGKMSESEILEAEAGHAKRKSQESRAKQDVITAMNRVRTYVSLSDSNVPLSIDFSAYLKSERIKPEFSDTVAEAFKNRPEYLAAKMKIDREDVLIRYAENQRWPQLDLIGSYGLNGLGDSPGDSWSDETNGDYHTWKVGASLTIPLMGGLKTRSELSIAQHHKRQAILELKSAETDIVNRVDTALKEVLSAYEQVDFSTRAREVYQRLLGSEMVMLNAGRSNSRSVLDKEEDLNYAKEQEVESFVYSKKAELALSMAQGLLLGRYGIDVSEERFE
ncbi:MAG: TolC family protein [Desulfobacteraceae bacterium]